MEKGDINELQKTTQSLKQSTEESKLLEKPHMVLEQKNYLDRIVVTGDSKKFSSEKDLMNAITATSKNLKEATKPLSEERRLKIGESLEKIFTKTEHQIVQELYEMFDKNSTLKSETLQLLKKMVLLTQHR